MRVNRRASVRARERSAKRKGAYIGDGRKSGCICAAQSDRKIDGRISAIETSTQKIRNHSSQLLPVETTDKQRFQETPERWAKKDAWQKDWGRFRRNRNDRVTSQEIKRRGSLNPE